MSPDRAKLPHVFLPQVSSLSRGATESVVSHTGMGYAKGGLAHVSAGQPAIGALGGR